VVAATAMLVGLAGGVLGIYLLDITTQEGAIIAEMAALGCLIGFFVGRWTIVESSRLQALAFYRATPRLRAEREYRADASGVATISDYGESRWRWPAFSDPAISHGLVMLWLEQSTAIAIPLRVFASEAQAGQFVAFARARVAEATSGLPSGAETR